MENKLTYDETHPTVSFRVASIALRDQIKVLGGLQKVLGLAFCDVRDGKQSVYTDLAEAIL